MTVTAVVREFSSGIIPIRSFGAVRCMLAFLSKMPSSELEGLGKNTLLQQESFEHVEILQLQLAIIGSTMLQHQHMAGNLVV